MIYKSYMGFFKTFCNDTRLSIVLCLMEKPMHVGQIVKELKMEQSRISHNLQCLEKNGFVKVKREGKQRIYSLNKDTVVPILDGGKKHIKTHNSYVC